jgi:phosphoribosylformylglycinamidine (FGAM) synthase-like enzyme
VGLIDKPEHITTQWFKDEGDAILLLGEPVDASDPLLGLGGSAYLQLIHGLKTGTPPRCDLVKEQELHLALRSLIYSGVVKSAHDCSEGGLAVALAECCISQQIGRETPRLIGAEIDVAVWRNTIAHRHLLQTARRRESGRARQAHGRSGGSNRQSRRRQIDGENGERRIFRATHGIARRLVEFHRAGDGLNFV